MLLTHAIRFRNQKDFAERSGHPVGKFAASEQTFPMFQQSNISGPSYARHKANRCSRGTKHAGTSGRANAENPVHAGPLIKSYRDQDVATEFVCERM
jgi:hypothetical protein